jgi:hypothetical protein
MRASAFLITIIDQGTKQWETVIPEQIAEKLWRGRKHKEML